MQTTSRGLFLPQSLWDFLPLATHLEKSDFSVDVESGTGRELHSGFLSSSMSLSAWPPSAVHKSPELPTERKEAKGL